MLRPAIVISTSPDPLIIYGVRQIDMGIQYVSTLLELGIWPKEKLVSAAAKAYVDRKANHRGAAFELEIAQLVELVGWRAFRALPMRQLGASKKLGDVDVLAISPDGAIWVVIECKWFGAARTPREVAGWLQNYRGHGGDKLERHLTRHTWIELNAEIAARSLQVAPPSTVLGRIVTTSPVPLKFTEETGANAIVWIRQILTEMLKALYADTTP